MMISILFVDDDPMVLDEIRLALHSKRLAWNFEFAESGVEALNALAGKHFDVIISDMKMPEMDGFALLTKVKEIYPEMIRHILCDAGDQDSIVHGFQVTNQIVIKPIIASQLIESLEHTASFLNRIQCQEVRQLVASVKSVPSRPKTALKISAMVSTGEPTIREIQNLIEQDPGLAARVLQIANSAYCGRSREVADIGLAISYIGVDFILALAFANDVFKITPENRHLVPLIDSTYEKAILGSLLVSKFLRGDTKVTIGITASLLRDIGLIITAPSDRTVLERSLINKAENEELFTEFEFRLLGLTHAEVGAHLLALWGLPMVIVEAVARHHSPEQSTVDPMIMAAIHVADVAAEYSGESRELIASKINWTYIESHGLAQKAHSWLDKVAELAA